MKTESEMKKELSKFNETEKQSLNSIAKLVEEVSKNASVNDDNFNRLTNALAELNIFRENMMRRIFRLLKQNHMVD
jgi:Txe/YoeB family toxin of Txe-Axe toxin-antitoxin module